MAPAISVSALAIFLILSQSLPYASATPTFFESSTWVDCGANATHCDITISVLNPNDLVIVYTGQGSGSVTCGFQMSSISDSQGNTWNFGNDQCYSPTHFTIDTYWSIFTQGLIGDHIHVLYSSPPVGEAWIMVVVISKPILPNPLDYTFAGAGCTGAKFCDLTGKSTNKDNVVILGLSAEMLSPPELSTPWTGFTLDQSHIYQTGSVSISLEHQERSIRQSSATYGMNGTSTSANWLFIGVAIDVQTNIPSEPRSLTGTPLITGNNLTWLPPTDNGGASLTGYKIYRATILGQETLYATIGNTTNFLDSSAACGVKYYYLVTAVNSLSVEGLASAEISVVTSPLSCGGTQNQNQNNLNLQPIIAFVISMIIVFSPAIAFMVLFKPHELFGFLIGAVIGSAIGQVAGVVPIWLPIILVLALFGYIWSERKGGTPA